ncbi:hypothetical protein [Cognatishimia sp. MH4019]|uniref:hypothetical protein n=1 Tax=Cognatishimia sp. MH4019 TaxID=2854030 RepID=UPI001CD5471C|nr:hypothetical protein [Cognatishimia sp. MH4019]
MKFFYVEQKSDVDLTRQVICAAPSLFGGTIGHELREMLSHAHASEVSFEEMKTLNVPVNAWRDTDGTSVANSVVPDRTLVIGEPDLFRRVGLRTADFPVSETLHRKRLIVFPDMAYKVVHASADWSITLARFGRLPANLVWRALRFEPQPSGQRFERIFRRKSWWKKSNKLLLGLFNDPAETFLFGNLIVPRTRSSERLVLAARLSGLVTTSTLPTSFAEFTETQEHQRHEALRSNAQRYEACFQKLFDLKEG